MSVPTLNAELRSRVESLVSKESRVRADIQIAEAQIASDRETLAGMEALRGEYEALLARRVCVHTWEDVRRLDNGGPSWRCRNCGAGRA